MEHINKDNIPEQGSEQPWQHADLSWDAMKDGIYRRIEQEDPDFFPKERRRRIAPFWFAGLAVLVLVGSLTTGAFLWLRTSKNSTQVNSDTLRQSSNSESKSLDNNSDPTVLKSNQGQISARGETESVQRLPEKKKSDRESIAYGKPDQAFVATHDGGRKKETPNSESDISHQSSIAVENDLRNSSNEQFGVNTHQSLQASNANTNSIAPIQNTTEQYKHDISFIFPLVQPIKLLQHQSSIRLPRQVLYSDLSDTKTAHIPSAKKYWTLALLTDCDFAFTPLDGIVQEVELRNAHSSPVFGFGYGLRAYRSGDFGNGAYLGAGMQHLYQGIDISTERVVNVHTPNVLTSITHYVVGQREVREYKDTIIPAIEKNRLVNYNKYQIAQIEFGMTRNYQLHKWNIQPTFGNSIGYLLSQKGYTVARDGGIFAISKQMPVRKALVWQLQAGMEIGRQINRQNRIQFAYQIGYSPLNWSAEGSISYRPLRHQVQIGVSHTIRPK